MLKGDTVTAIPIDTDPMNRFDDRLRLLIELTLTQ